MHPALLSRVFFPALTSPQDNPVEPTVIKTGDDTSLGSFDVNLETIVAIHGQNGKGRGLDAIAKAYLSIGKYNVIELDWSGPSTGSYNDVKDNVYPVGALGAKLLDYLATKGLNLTRVHIQGVSLGGQVSGIIGGNVTAGKIGRISVVTSMLHILSQ
ncbi:unnamed protein product [Timema podura]|uniref:Lipase domain-containing protein n=1 Tax=Timema podura TaxID=61482 RepID=A0ABN7NYA0_TIMPD|nr:unnamed protein product [Timema podura]